jgi:hypothetical protein
MAGITDLVYTDQSNENCIEQKHSTQDMTDHTQYKHIILVLHVYYESCTFLYKVVSRETMVIQKSRGKDEANKTETETTNNKTKPKENT